MVSKVLLDLLWLCNQLLTIFDGSDFVCFGFYFGYILEKKVVLRSPLVCHLTLAFSFQKHSSIARVESRLSWAVFCWLRRLFV